MINPRLVKSIKRLHRRLNGSTIETNLKRFEAILYKIKACQTVWEWEMKWDFQKVPNHGKGKLRNFINGTFAAFPDINIEIKSFFLSGDWYGSDGL